MNCKTIVVGPFEVNSYILWNDTTREALVVDPGEDAADIISYIRENNLVVKAYLLTHGHTDHICALADVYKACPAPVLIDPRDEKWAFSPQNKLPPYYPSPQRPDAEYILLEDQMELSYAGFAFNVISTPGHSPGGCCFYFPEEKMLISGDTLFQGSVGRTDNPGGDARTLTQSLRQLATLPDDIQVFPGHGPATDIRTEKVTNFFMQNALRSKP